MTKPDNDTIDAVKLYDHVLSLLALSDIYSKESIAAVIEWLKAGSDEYKTDGATKKVVEAIITFLDNQR